MRCSRANRKSVTRDPPRMAKSQVHLVHVLLPQKLRWPVCERPSSPTGVCCDSYPWFA